jgi:N-acetylneuraminic acid mutarotase
MRFPRHLIPLLALAVPLVLVPIVASPAVDLPGPSVRSLLGIGAATATVRPCTPSPRTVRRPAGDAPAGSWHPEPDLPRALTELEAVTLGRRVYVFGGETVNGRSVRTMASYSPATGRYGAEPDLPRRLDHTASVVRDGEIYVTGGYTDGDPTTDFWRYSPATRRWTRLPSMPTPRAGHGAAIIGQRLYVVGGGPRTFPDESVAALRSLDIYDFAKRRWSAGPDMPTARHHLAATAYQGKLYVIGGRTPGDFSLDTVERYDPARRRWERLPGVPLGVSDARAESVGGRLVLTGGDEEEGWTRGVRGWVTPAVWAFDSRAGAWTRLPDLGTPRHGHAAAVVGGRLFVFGGTDCPGYSRIRTAESLDVRRGDARPHASAKRR